MTEKFRYKRLLIRPIRTNFLTQIRSGKIGLAAFLHKCRVPGFESPACPCGWQWETAKHVR